MSLTRPIFEVDRPRIKVGHIVRLRHKSGIYVGFEVVGTRQNWVKVRSLPHPTAKRRFGFIPIQVVDLIQDVDGAAIWVGDV